MGARCASADGSGHFQATENRPFLRWHSRNPEYLQAGGGSAPELHIGQICRASLFDTRLFRPTSSTSRTSWQRWSLAMICQENERPEERKGGDDDASRRWNRTAWLGPDERGHRWLRLKISGTSIHESEPGKRFQEMGARGRMGMAQLVSRNQPGRMAAGTHGQTDISDAIRPAVRPGNDKGTGTGGPEQPGGILPGCTGEHRETNPGIGVSGYREGRVVCNALLAE